MQKTVKVEIPIWVYEKLKELAEKRGETPEKTLIEIVKKKLVHKQSGFVI